MLGQSVRSVKEALAVADDDLDALTALLDVRLVAGDAALVDDLDRRRCASSRPGAATGWSGRWPPRPRTREARPGSDRRDARAQPEGGGRRAARPPDAGVGRLGAPRGRASRPPLPMAGRGTAASRCWSRAGTCRRAIRARLRDARRRPARRAGRAPPCDRWPVRPAAAPGPGRGGPAGGRGRRRRAGARARRGGARGRLDHRATSGPGCGRPRPGPTTLGGRDRELGHGVVLRDGRIALDADATLDTALVLRAAAHAAALRVPFERATLARLEQLDGRAVGRARRATRSSRCCAPGGARSRCSRRSTTSACSCGCSRSGSTCGRVRNGTPTTASPSTGTRSRRWPSARPCSIPTTRRARGSTATSPAPPAPTSCSSPRCSTTSPRAAPATTPWSGSSRPARSRPASGSTTRGPTNWRGRSVTTCCSPTPPPAATSATSARSAGSPRRSGEPSTTRCCTR